MPLMPLEIFFSAWLSREVAVTAIFVGCLGLTFFMALAHSQTLNASIKYQYSDWAI